MDWGSRQVAFLGGCGLGLVSITRSPHLAFLPFLVGALMLARNYVVFREVLLSNHGPATQPYITDAPQKATDTSRYAGVEGQVATDPWRTARVVRARW